MPLRNLTPLPCLPMDAKTPAGGERSVVIVKATLDLVPAGAELRAAGFTHFLKLAQEQRPLVFSDVYSGAFQTSSLLWESDLAPTKPRCDVIVLGEAWAPEGRPRRSFEAGLRLTAPDRERPGSANKAPVHSVPGEVILDKQFRMTGERWLKRRMVLSRAIGWLLKVGTLGMARPCPWRLTKPEPTSFVPLRYEFAYGGHLQVRAGDPAFRRVPRKHWLPGVNRKDLTAAAASGGNGILAEAWWEENPVGRGYAPAWLLKSARLKRWSAPQIEDPGQPFTAKAAWSASRGDRGMAGCLRPQGTGVITRRWASRLKYAGTWDEAWNQSGAPYFPGFQDAFWNAAHPDLQCRHLAGNEVVELTNLCPVPTGGLMRDAKGNGVMRFALPDQFPYLLLYFESWEIVQVPGLLDTLVIEPAESRVTLVYRASYVEDPELEDVELGLAMAGEPRELPAEYPRPGWFG